MGPSFDRGGCFLRSYDKFLSGNFEDLSKLFGIGGRGFDEGLLFNW